MPETGTSSAAARVFRRLLSKRSRTSSSLCATAKHTVKRSSWRSRPRRVYRKPRIRKKSRRSWLLKPTWLRRRWCVKRRLWSLATTCPRSGPISSLSKPSKRWITRTMSVTWPVSKAVLRSLCWLKRKSRVFLISMKWRQRSPTRSKNNVRRISWNRKRKTSWPVWLVPTASRRRAKKKVMKPVRKSRSSSAHRSAKLVRVQRLMIWSTVWNPASLARRRSRLTISGW